METQERSSMEISEVSSLSISKIEMEIETEEKAEVEVEVEVEAELAIGNQETVLSPFPNSSLPDISTSSTLQEHSVEHSTAATLHNTSMSANSEEAKLDTSQNNRNVNEMQQSTMGTNDLFDEHVEVTVVSQLEVEVEVEVDMMKEPEI